MKLNRCYIAGFGTFTETEICFEAKLHPLLEKNGYGKTTLAQFISAMLYGMPTTRAGSESIREQYLPWKGGKYGGMLELTANDTVYRIERSFDQKSETKDCMKIFNLNFPDQPIDLQNKTPGEKFLGINKETFIRTAFYSGTPGKDKSDLIARVSATLSDSSDPDSYQNAIKLLDEQRKQYKADKGKTGELYRIQKALDEQEDLLIESITADRQTLTYKKELAELQSRRRDLQQEINDADAYQRYTSDLKKHVTAKESAKSELYNFSEQFPALPDAEQLEALHEMVLAADLKKDTISQASAKLNNPSTSMQCFKSDGSLDKEMEETEQHFLSIKLAEDLLKQKTDPRNDRYFSISAHFEGKNISDEEIVSVKTLYEQYSTAARQVHEMREAQFSTVNRTQKKKTDFSVSIPVLLGGLLILVGCVLLMVNYVFAIIALLLGASAIVLAFLLGRRKKDDLDPAFSELDEKMQIYHSLREELSNRLSAYGYHTGEPEERYHRFTNELQQYQSVSAAYREYSAFSEEKQREIAEHEQAISTFLSRFSFLDGKTDKAAFDLLKKRYAAFKADIVRFTSAQCTLEEQKNDLQKLEEDFLTKVQAFSVDLSSERTIRERYNTLQNHFNTFAELNRNYTDVLEKTRAFLESTPRPKQPSAAFDRTSADAQISRIDEQIEEKKKQLHFAEMKSENRDDYVQTVESLKGKLKECNNHHRLLVLARDLLTQANDRMKAELARPLHQNYCKYAKMIEPSLAEALNIDIYSLSFLYEREGGLRKVEGFSAGQRAISDICLRLALIDLIYEKEKPCVVLDDPFVHLDGENLKNALTAVHALSEEVQILYFTCHESRMPL